MDTGFQNHSLTAASELDWNCSIMAKKKKGEGPQRKRIKFEVNADIDQTRFLKVYDSQCAEDKSAPCPWLVKALKKGIEDRAYTREFIIEHQADPPVHLDPILLTIRKAHYLYIHSLRVWDHELAHTTIALLALLIEKGVYPIERIELMDCDVLDYSCERLARTFKVSNLSELNFDYNEFGDEGCRKLCRGCKMNKTITSLSLCYCKLTWHSGVHLGEVLFGSAVRDLYLDGNTLESRGVADMMNALATSAEVDNIRRIEEEKAKALSIAEGVMTDHVVGKASGADTEGGASSAGEGKKKKTKKKKAKKGKKKKKEADPPLVGPFVHKLHLADNGIDPFSRKREDGLFSCIGILCRLIMYSNCLMELDLDDNPVGDLAGREILEALNRRKEGNLPSLKVTVTGEIQKGTFSSIMKLASGLTKKKKKGKKKKKKK